MTFRKSYLSYFLSYWPGLVVLAISMIALYSALLLINEYSHVTVLQAHNNALNPAAPKVLYPDLKLKASKVYWSVIALGLSGFVLVLLNSDKLRRLGLADEERRRNMKLLERRQAAMEATFDGIGIVDPDGNLSYMNSALMRLHAIDPVRAREFIGKPWQLLYNEQGQKQIREEILSELFKLGYWRGTSPISRRDGTVVHAELSLTRLPDGGMIGTARDITDKLDADRQKEELQSQFFQAQKMEAIGRLAGGIAHDFNNILAAMNGYAEFLTDDLDKNSVQYGFAANILQAGKQARALVDQMLAFSRREDKEVKKFDLVALVQENISMLKASLPKSIIVEANIQVSAVPVEGNTTRISQVIMNLCVNAKDAMEQEEKGDLEIGLRLVDSDSFENTVFLKDSPMDRGATPVVRMEDVGPGRTRLFLNHLERGRPYVCLSVSDDGCGMSRTIMNHIFEPFFTTKPVDKGTGLGLSTVHGVVTGHSGAMIVDSALGEGTVFKLFFPVAEGKADKKDDEPVAIAKNALNAHIHLVEDQEEVRDMMTIMLQRLGYEVTSSTTGLEGLKYLKRAGDDVDLVITDHNMPKMTGLDMVSQLHLTYPDLPFILVSGYSLEKLEDLMHEHPAIRAVLRKPVSRPDLAQKIESVLTEHKFEKKSA